MIEQKTNDFKGVIPDYTKTKGGGGRRCQSRRKGLVKRRAKMWTPAQLDSACLVTDALDLEGSYRGFTDNELAQSSLVKGECLEAVQRRVA